MFTKKQWLPFVILILIIQAAAEAMIVYNVLKLGMLPTHYLVLLFAVLLLLMVITMLLLWMGIDKEASKKKKIRRIFGIVFAAIIVIISVFGSSVVEKAIGAINKITDDNSSLEEQGVSVGDAFIQVEWLVRELWQPEFKPVLEVLQNSVSIRECCDYLVRRYLRPADQSDAVCAYRAKLAREFYNEFAELEAEDPEGQPETVEVPEKEYDLMSRAMLVVLALKDLIRLMGEFEDEY